MSIRPVKRLVQARPAIEGAGVHLRRAFGFGNTEDFDPFLLFDDFRTELPELYRNGFPWHPHRGIETITYVLAGAVDHGDSLGNSGSISPGDVQWMTAGSGIVHQEMPRGDAAGRMHGFQLWANLPASLKMTPPRYQDIHAADVPEVIDDDGTVVRVICGNVWGRTGPVDGIAADPNYIDVRVPPLRTKTIPVETSRHAFAYIFEGSGVFRNASDPLPAPTEGVEDGQGPNIASSPDSVNASDARIEHRADDRDVDTVADDRSLVLFDRGDDVVVHAGEHGIRFLLVSGRPLREPVAWYGPIVMNTREELMRAYQELQDGTFLRDR